MTNNTMNDVLEFLDYMKGIDCKCPICGYKGEYDEMLYDDAKSDRITGCMMCDGEEEQ